MSVFGVRALPFENGSDPGVLLGTCMIRSLCSLLLALALAGSTATAMAAPVADEQLQQLILLSRHNLAEKNGPGFPGPLRFTSHRRDHSIGWSSISWRAKRTGGAP